MFIIRWILGQVILALNFIFTPRSIKRDPQIQKNIDEQTQYLSLYQLPACPFCVKVRRTIKRQALKIETRNIKEDLYLTELINEGGKRTVPCLKIAKPNENVIWLYESKAIVNYLNELA